MYRKGKCLVTGASGFVGSALCQTIEHRGFPVVPVVRRQMCAFPDGLVIDDIGANTDWATALKKVNVVIHTAARVHVTRETAGNPLAEFRRVNVTGTERLAREAARVGVRRFIFLSSVKVNGETTTASKPFRETDTPHPMDPYGVSKWEAEQLLQRIAKDTGLEVVIIRPPLVYGPQVKANFLSLLRVAARRVPLPVASVHNKRSLIARDNLVDVIIHSAIHPAAAGETFLVSDGEDLSTPELVSCIRDAMGKPRRLVAVPPPILKAGLRLVGMSSVYGKLCDSLQVDSAQVRERLNWRPIVSMDTALKSTVEWYIKGFARGRTST